MTSPSFSLLTVSGTALSQSGLLLLLLWEEGESGLDPMPAPPSPQNSMQAGLKGEANSL